MPKVKYDVSDVEDAVFQQPKPGLYPCKVEALDPGTSKAGNDQLICQFRIKSGEFKGALLWHYVPLDTDAPGYFRMAELLKALGEGKDKGHLDTDKHVGDDIQIRVKAGSYQGEYRAQVGAVLPGADGEEEEEGLSEEEEPEEKPARKRSRRRPEPEPEPEPEPDDDDDDGAKEDGADDDDDDYDEWEVQELQNELKERQLRTAGNKTALIKRLRADDQEDEDPFA